MRSTDRLLPPNDVAHLLDELCSRAGFCLPMPERQRLEADPPPDEDAFTKAVLDADALRPRTAANRRVYDRVHAVVEAAFCRRRASNERVESSAWFETLRIIEHLVEGRYGAVETRTGGRRLSADQLWRAVVGYGRRLRIPPSRDAADFEMRAPVGPDAKRWAVRCDLWTEEEGRSRLRLELSLAALDDGPVDVEVEGLHVR